MQQMSSTVIRLGVVGAMGGMLMACLASAGPESRKAVGQSSQAIGELCFSDADCSGGNAYCDFSQSIDPSLGGMCNLRPGCGIGTQSPCVELGTVTFTPPTTYCANCICGNSVTFVWWSGTVCDESQLILEVDCAGMCL